MFILIRLDMVALALFIAKLKPEVLNKCTVCGKALKLPRYLLGTIVYHRYLVYIVGYR